MPFGLASAPTVFQSLVHVHEVLGGLLDKTVVEHLDDISVSPV